MVGVSVAAGGHGVYRGVTVVLLLLLLLINGGGGIEAGSVCFCVGGGGSWTISNVGGAIQIPWYWHDIVVRCFRYYCFYLVSLLFFLV